jgi:uncharacterized membrane protein
VGIEVQQEQKKSAMKKNVFPALAVWIVWAGPLLYLGCQYASMPERIPVHWGFSGKPNGFADKSQSWLTTGLLAAVAAAVYLLLKNLPSIDPKRTARQSAATFHKIAVALVFFFSALNLGIIYATVHGELAITRLISPLTGLLFMYLGNLMHSIKPNYFVGIRVPWTLEDPDNWRATHQMGSKLWFVGGLVITITSLVLPVQAGEVVFLLCTAILVVVPIGFSFIYFKKNNRT